MISKNYLANPQKGINLLYVNTIILSKKNCIYLQDFVPLHSKTLQLRHVKIIINQPSGIDFYGTLETMLDAKHPLFILANMIDWAGFEKAFAPLFSADNGRPSKSIRLMTGLLMLKHLRNVSEEQAVAQFSENAYYQYFCGTEAFCVSAPCASSELIHFRN